MFHPFKCQYCIYSSKYKHDLKRHLKNIHGDTKSISSLKHSNYSTPPYQISNNMITPPQQHSQIINFCPEGGGGGWTQDQGRQGPVPPHPPVLTQSDQGHQSESGGQETKIKKKPIILSGDDLIDTLDQKSSFDIRFEKHFKILVSGPSGVPKKKLF